MIKLVAPLLATVLLVPLATTAARADYTPACSSETRDAEVPSGSQTDANGRIWVGFKDGGLPPDSLSKSSEATTCDAYAPPP